MADLSPHEQLIEDAKDACNKVFSDTSVSQEETITALMDVRDEIDHMIGLVRQDMERDEEE